MKKLFMSLLIILLIAGCVIGGAAAYRFDADPDTPLGEGVSLIDSIYNWQMNFSNRIFLNGLYGLDLSESDVDALFADSWLPEPGYVGPEVQITLPDGSEEAVSLFIVEDAEEEGKVSKTLRRAADGMELLRK